MPEKNSEFEKFNATMQKLMRVSHEEIKAKLDAEKAAKKQTRKRKKDSSDKRD